ncbi:MAG: hypothetical protein U5L10_02320 [Candidatus Moranbacteria bacterium]|nr:hypothetical protein [Candidatus Moranbacteria bacterium]
MKIIAISGLDGSGKSCQLEKLEKNLKNKNHKVRRFHMVDFSIANKILRPKKKKTSGKTASKTSASGKAVFLRKVALIIDVFRFRHFFLLNARFKKIDYLLTDRYFFDQIANIKYLERNKSLAKIPFWQKVVEKYALKPDYGFYLRITPEEITKRSGGVEQGLQYLKDKFKIYEFFYKKWGLRSIDGSQSIEAVENKILQEMNISKS